MLVYVSALVRHDVALLALTVITVIGQLQLGVDLAEPAFTSRTRILPLDFYFYSLFVASLRVGVLRGCVITEPRWLDSGSSAGNATLTNIMLCQTGKQPWTHVSCGARRGQTFRFVGAGELIIMIQYISSAVGLINWVGESHMRFGGLNRIAGFR